MIKMTERELRDKLKITRMERAEITAGRVGNHEEAVEAFKKSRVAYYQEKIRRGEIQLVRENGTDILPQDLDWERWEASWDEPASKGYHSPTGDWSKETQGDNSHEAVARARAKFGKKESKYE